MARKGNGKPNETLRARAEQIALATATPDERPVVADQQRHFHDLQVHQIELEIQNEELRSSQVELDESRESFVTLFEFSPIGYLTLDSRLRITKANIAAAELLETSEKALIGTTLSRFIAKADADTFYFHCRNARASHKRETCDIRLASSTSGTRVVQLHSILIRAADNERERFQIALTDISAREQAKEELVHAQTILETRVRERTRALEQANQALVATDLELRKLSSAVKQSRSSIAISNREGFVEYVNPRFTEVTGYTLDEIRGKNKAMLLADTALEINEEDVRRTVESGRDWRGTLQNAKKNGELYWEESCISPIFDEHGEVSHFLTVGEEITARKAAEERQRLLVAELDHRVKNTLSVVLSIAKQTLRTTASFDSFREAFEGRLMALAQVHRLLTKNRWGAVLMEDLINLAARPYTDSEGPSAIVNGPPLRLAPKDAQSLHLIFHELATNAAKYGAFSVPGGHVEATWEIRAAKVYITWIESGGPATTAPSRLGFGHELIERTIVDGLGGEAAADYCPAGLEWRAVFPLPESSVLLPLFASSTEPRTL